MCTPVAGLGTPTLRFTGGLGFKSGQKIHFLVGVFLLRKSEKVITGHPMTVGSLYMYMHDRGAEHNRSKKSKAKKTEQRREEPVMRPRIVEKKASRAGNTRVK